MRFLLNCGILFGIAYWVFQQGFFFGGPFAHLPVGRVAPDQPVQIAASKSAFSYLNYEIKPTYRFSVKALVLSKKTYNSDRGSDLMPVDLALGWGAMSNKVPLQHIRIYQYDRFYYTQYSGTLPISPREIGLNSSNMHLIPANDDVRNVLSKVKKGSVVSFTGYLVNLIDKDGYTWKSSTTRADTGAGACEIVYVEKITIEPQ